MIYTQKAYDLKHESETKAYLPWYLSCERLIESRIRRDTSISEPGQNLVRESAVEHGPESI